MTTETQEGNLNFQQIVELLQTACTKSEVGKYGLALSAIRRARKSNPDNSYVAAIEEQIELLLNLSQENQLSTKHKRGILQALSVFSKYATEEAEQEAGFPEGPGAPAAEISMLKSDAEKSSMERLKCQYFEDAGSFLDKGNYHGALSEIRRVYVIDPDNFSAHDFENTILELLALNHGKDPKDLLPSNDDCGGRDPAPPAVRDLRGDVPASGSVTSMNAEKAQGTRESNAASIEGFSCQTEKDLSVYDEQQPELVTSPRDPLTGPTQGVYVQDLILQEKMHWPDEELSIPKAGLATDVLAVPGPAMSDVSVPMKPETHQKSRALSLVLAAAFLGWTGDSFHFFAQAKITEVNHASAPATSFSVASRQTPPAATGVHLQHTTQDVSTPGSIVPRSQETLKPTKKAVSSLSAQKDSSPESPERAEAPPADQLTLAPRTVSDLKPSTNIGGVNSELRPVPLESKGVAANIPENQGRSADDIVYIERAGELTRLEKPQLPVGTKDARFLGRLTVRIRIDAQGKPLQAEILKSSNKIFDVPMVDAILKSQFTPAQTSSGPVASWLVIPINLEDYR